MGEDRADRWLKILDQDSGRIVSGSNWKMYPTWAAIEPSVASVDWYPSGSAEREAAQHVLNDFLSQRKKHMYTHAHVRTSAFLLHFAVAVAKSFQCHSPRYSLHRLGMLAAQMGFDDGEMGM